MRFVKALLRLWRGCWRLDHIWVEAYPITTRGLYAVLAGFWIPKTTCRRCGSKQAGINEQYAAENEWTPKTMERA